LPTQPSSLRNGFAVVAEMTRDTCGQEIGRTAPLVPNTRCSRTTDVGNGTEGVSVPLKRAGKSTCKRHFEKRVEKRFEKTPAKTLEIHQMRKVILAATALAFLSSTAFAQSTDKAGGTTGPAAQSGDTMSKGDASKDKMAPKKKSKKSAKKSSDDAK
jgi:hypothetical protein